LAVDYDKVAADTYKEINLIRATSDVPFHIWQTAREETLCDNSAHSLDTKSYGDEVVHDFDVFGHLA